MKYLLYLAEIWAIVLILGVASKHFPVLDQPKTAQAAIISPLPDQKTATAAATITPTVSPTQERLNEQTQIENYIRTIFGSDASVAIAVSHNECGPTNAAYPKCRLHTQVEDSIGLFQINLYNAKQWIHAGRIPGDTMAEKINWLKNPYNNTLYAYWVFKTSGWSPWSSYQSGAYLSDL